MRLNILHIRFFRQKFAENYFLQLKIKRKMLQIHRLQILDILVVMLLSLLWKHFVWLADCVYSSNNGVLYTIGISMTRRIKKRIGSSVRNGNKMRTPSLFTVE